MRSKEEADFVVVFGSAVGGEADVDASVDGVDSDSVDVVEATVGDGVTSISPEQCDASSTTAAGTQTSQQRLAMRLCICCDRRSPCRLIRARLKSNDAHRLQRPPGHWVRPLNPPPSLDTLLSCALN